MTSVKAGKSGDTANAAEVLLLRRVAENDRDAFDELFQNYHPRLFTFLFRLTRSHGSAEELANDVLLTLWKDAGRFRGESKVSTWVFGIAYRQALAHLRKRKLKLVPFFENDKVTVMLVYFLGLSCEETASATGVPVSTVKTRMFHARRKLKLHLAASSVPQDSQKDTSDD